MQKHTYKFLFLLLLISFGFNSKEKNTNKSICAGSYSEEDFSYTFFEPITFKDLIEYSEVGSNSYNNNIAAWQRFFGKEVSFKDIRKVVYEMDISELEQIKEQMSPKSSKQNTSNQVFRYWLNTKETESLDYLIFAKKCEPLVIGGGSDWIVEKAEIEPKQANELIKEASNFYKKTKSDFLKLRYAYQIVRLAHYSKQYNQTVKYYDKMVAPLFTKGGLIKYWAMEHKAGALAKMNKLAEAAYLFSVVFDNSSSRRAFSFNSFRIATDASWNKALQFCKTPREKANLYFIRGLQKNADILAEMKEIYREYPKAQYLERHLVLLMQNFEKELLSKYRPSNILLSDNIENEQQEQLKYLQELQVFLKKVNQETKVKNPYLWVFAESYTYFLQNNQEQALKTLNSTKYSTVKAQKRKKVIELAMRLAKLNKVDDATEVEFYTQVKNTKDKELYDFMVKVFARMYILQKEEAKAFLALQNINGLRQKISLDLTDKILLWSEQKKNIFEREVLLKSLGNTPKENVKELKASILFGQNKLTEAVKIYESLSKNYQLKADPFKARFKDCLDCDREDYAVNTYTRLTLAKSLLKLQKQVETNPKPEDYFRLGVAFYNMTYFGNSWDAHHYNRSTYYLWNYNYEKENRSKNKILYNLDCSQALNYFKKSIELAEQTGNVELAAKANYFAAKCEQNEYYLSEKFDHKKFAFEKGYSYHFGQLKKNYRNTQFYKEALKECFYLKLYDYQ